MAVVTFLFVLSHALFLPHKPSSEEIIKSSALKAKLGGVDLALVGLDVAFEDNQSDSKTQELNNTVTKD
jgi:hypothetical protein